MSKSFRKDLTGQRFGRLTVLKFVPNNKHESYWLCRCDCGNETVVKRGCLIHRDTQSCGCYNREKASERLSHYMFKHGGKRTELYQVWANMKARCCNKNVSSYKDYGGRGIKVCDEWQNDFQSFRDWAMMNGYRKGLSIDRIDVNGNYEPRNCRWATMAEKARNKRNNVIVEYDGEKISLSDAAEKSGINLMTLQTRYYHGDRGERLFRPVRPYK